MYMLVRLQILNEYFPPYTPCVVEVHVRRSNYVRAMLYPHADDIYNKLDSYDLYTCRIKVPLR